MTVGVHSTALDLKYKYGGVTMDIYVDMAKIDSRMRNKIAKAFRDGIYPVMQTPEAELYKELASLAALPWLKVKQGRPMPEAIRGQHAAPRNYSWYVTGGNVPPQTLDKLHEILEADIVGGQLSGRKRDPWRNSKFSGSDFSHVEFTTIKSLEHLKDALVHVKTPEYQQVAEYLAQQVLRGETVKFKH